MKMILSSSIQSSKNHDKKCYHNNKFYSDKDK